VALSWIDPPNGADAFQFPISPPFVYKLLHRAILGPPMKYFTKAMWRGSQQIGPEAEQNHLQWVRAFEEHRANLEGLRGRVGEQVHDFFANTDIHDAELLDVHIIDGSRPAPLCEPARPWQSLTAHPVRVKLMILDALDQYVWRVVYSSTRLVLIDFPSDDPLFNRGGGGFEDLGYHELTDAGDGFLRHEILFSSGAILAFEFKDVVISSTLARAAIPQSEQ
jgi:hypothetical protein